MIFVNVPYLLLFCCHQESFSDFLIRPGPVPQTLIETGGLLMSIWNYRNNWNLTFKLYIIPHKKEVLYTFRELWNWISCETDISLKQSKWKKEVFEMKEKEARLILGKKEWKRERASQWHRAGPSSHKDSSSLGLPQIWDLESRPWHSCLFETGFSSLWTEESSPLTYAERLLVFWSIEDKVTLNTFLLCFWRSVRHNTCSSKAHH